MKVLAILGTVLCIAGAPCYASTLSGKLMDAGCYNEKKVASQESGHKTYHSITKTCAATSSSTEFVVRVTSGPYGEYQGETIKLDQQGDSMAADAMRAGTLKPDSDGDIHVHLSGKVLADELFQTKSITGRHGGAASQIESGQ